MEKQITICLQIIFAVIGYGNMIYLISKNKGDAEEHDPIIWIITACLHSINSYSLMMCDGEYTLSVIMAGGALSMSCFTSLHFTLQKTPEKFLVYGFLVALVAVGITLNTLFPKTLVTTHGINFGLVILSALQINLFTQFEGKNPILSWWAFIGMSLSSVVVYKSYDQSHLTQPVISALGNLLFLMVPFLSKFFKKIKPFQRIVFENITIQKYEVQDTVEEYIQKKLLFWDNSISKIIKDKNNPEDAPIKELIQNFVLSVSGTYESGIDSADIYCVSRNQLYAQPERCSSVLHFVRYATKKNYKSLTYWQFFCLLYSYPDSLIKKVVDSKLNGYQVVVSLKFFTKKKRDIKLFLLDIKEGYLTIEQYQEEIDTNYIKILCFQNVQ